MNTPDVAYVSCHVYKCRKRVMQELHQAKALAAKCQSELLAVKTESHKRKRIIAAQQLVFQNGSDMYHKVSNTSE
jgi:hypothetical protein